MRGIAGIVNDCLRSPRRTPTREQIQAARDYVTRQRLSDAKRDEVAKLITLWGNQLGVNVERILSADNDEAEDGWDQLARRASAVPDTLRDEPLPDLAGARRGTVEARMQERIAQDAGESVCTGWTTSQWAKYLKCSRQSVAVTKTWQFLMSQRRQSGSHIA